MEGEGEQKAREGGAAVRSEEREEACSSLVCAIVSQGKYATTIIVSE